MPKKKNLQLNVASPCKENWDAMSDAGNGRLCSNCQKVVVDFSHLSDQELYNYFSKSTAIPCGRFHNDQLNKTILPLHSKKNVWTNFYKVAATVLAFLSLRSSEASTGKRRANTTIAPSPGKERTVFTADKIVISGIVKDQHGHTLENAEVKFGDSLTTTTDKEGRFKLEISDEKEIKSGLLIFSYPGLVPTARNYHPAMLSTSYEVMLHPPAGEAHFFTMGMPDIKGKLESMPSTTITFTNNDKTLTSKAKESLSLLATWLRNNPEIAITIMAYVRNNNNMDAGKKFQASIRRYLSDMEGIGEDRLKTEIYLVPDIKKNTVEIVGQQ